MPLEFTPPKYAVIVNAVQARIEAGTYPPGSTLPSEAALMKEFGVSRPTTVRALELLRQQGWIDAHQGRGRTVLGDPTTRGRTAPPYAHDVLGLPETAAVRVLSAGPVLAPPRAAAALGLPPNTPVIARRRLVVHDEIGPVELSTVYVPLDLATDTSIGDPAPLAGGVLAHLGQARSLVVAHVTQRISARTPTGDEADLLAIGRRDCLLTMLLSVHDHAGRPCVAIDTALPSGRRELDDSFVLE